MKFLVPNYSCLQNTWLRDYRPPDPRPLCPLSSTEFVEPPTPQKKFLGTPLFRGVIAVCFGWLREHTKYCTLCGQNTAVWRKSNGTYSSKGLTLISCPDLLQLVLPIKHTSCCDLELKMGDTFDRITRSQSQTNQRDPRLAIGSPLAAGSFPWWPVLYSVLKPRTDNVRLFFYWSCHTLNMCGPHRSSVGNWCLASCVELVNV